MTRQLRAEWVKLRSVRLLHGLVAAHVVVTLLQVVLVFVNAGRITTPSLGTTASFLRLVGASSYGQYLALVLGVLVVAGEHRHGTITATYLVRPARGVALGAKTLLAAAGGAGMAAVGLWATAAVAVPWLHALGVEVDVAHGRYAVAVAGTVVVAALYGVLGAGLAGLVPNATGVIGAALAYGIVVENLLVTLAFPRLLPWVPGGAATALVGVRVMPGPPVPAWFSASVLAAWVAVVLAGGWAATARRDVV